MNEKNKIRLGWAAFIFLVIHFSMILIFAWPEPHMPKKLKELSSAYVHPIFTQRWSMFAPCPYKSFGMRIKYEFVDGETSEWIRPAEDAITMHSKLRCTHHMEIALCESNLMYWVDKDLEEIGIPNKGILNDEAESEYISSYSHPMVKRYAYGNAHYLFDKEPLNALVECNVTDVTNGSSYQVVLPKLYWKN